jgi:serine/threonine-protein kinase HipA
MRKVEVFKNGVLAGILSEETRNRFVFRYDDTYFNDISKPAISLTLPKTKNEYTSDYLFPFFFNMLSEGVNRKLQSVLWKIDEEDDFGILMQTAQYDIIGAITIKPLLEK